MEKAIPLKELKKKIKKSMDENRYEHTMGVMYCCAALAMRYEYDVEKAMLAGLLHDCAKCMPNDKKLKTAEKHGIEVTRLERKNPFLLHAKLGAYLAEKKYGVTDKDILSAIRWHTTGCPEMTLLDKIVYVADYIEPKRSRAPNLKEVRRLSFIDIDRALLKILSDTLEYLKDSTEDIDLMTKMTYDYYINKQQEEHYGTEGL